MTFVSTTSCRAIMVYEPIFKKLPFYQLLTPVYDTTLFAIPQRHSKYLNRDFCFLIPEEFRERLCTSRKTVCHKKVEVQLRFCRRLSNLKSSHEIDDYFPPELEVCMNGYIVELPPFTDVECKSRRAKPVDITAFCKISDPNQIAVSWFSSHTDNYEYFFTIHLVERMLLDEIVKLMRVSGEKNSMNLVRESFGGRTGSTNSDLSMTSLTVSLLCPLSMQRMKYPSRSIYCTHVQCFDVVSYLQINEFKPSWKCPVCRDKAPFENLVIDGMFKRILLEKNASNEIQFAADGSWKFSPVCRSKNGIQDEDSSQENETETLNKSVLNLQKSRTSSPNQSKRSLVIMDAPKASSGRGRPRKLQSTTNSIHLTSMKKIKYQNESIDVTDLTLDSSDES